jgi:hypothetical protein
MGDATCDNTRTIKLFKTLKKKWRKEKAFKIADGVNKKECFL